MNIKLKINKHKYFPYLLKKTYLKKKVLLGIGGNIGDVKKTFYHLFIYLLKSKKVNIIESSIILENLPFGYLDQNNFFNALLFIKTNLSPFNLLNYILIIEKKFKRKRLFKNGPRTLDIDIIFYEGVFMKTKILTIPHYDWKNRDSILIPLELMKKKYFFKH